MQYFHFLLALCSRIHLNGEESSNHLPRELCIGHCWFWVLHGFALSPSLSDVQLLKVLSSANTVKVLVFKGFFNRYDQSRVQTKYCNWPTKLAWSGS